MDISFSVTQAVVGLSYGMFLFILGIGLSLELGIAHVLNFAHGSFYMLSAYITYTLVTRLGNSPGAFWIALIAAPIVVVLIAIGIEVSLFRRFYAREMFYSLLFTYALVLIISDIQKMIWGTQNLIIHMPTVLRGSVRIFNFEFSVYYLFVICVGPILFLILWFLLNRTKMGRYLRAASVDREMLSALGVDTQQLYTFTFAIGCALAGIAGVIGAGMSEANPGMAMEVIMPCFIVVIIGGMGSLGGTLVASIIIGLIESFGILFFPKFAMILNYILMAVILIVRPWGLLGRPEIYPAATEQ